MTGSAPLVSVIVPVYNVEPYLRECLNSIRGQTHQRLEVILVDDGSTDASSAICDTYAREDNRFRAIHQSNRGLSQARNIGVKHATGEWITFVDSDDWLDTSFVEELLQVARQYSTATTIMSSFVRVPGSEARLVSMQPELISAHQALARLAGREHTVFVISCAKLFQRRLFDGVEFPVGRLDEDEFTTHRLLRQGQVALVPRPLYKYRQREGAITSTHSIQRQLDGVEAAEHQLGALTSEGLMVPAARVFEQAFRKRARLINALHASGMYELAESEARNLRALARQGSALPLRPSFRALARLAEIRPSIPRTVFLAIDHGRTLRKIPVVARHPSSRDR